MMFKKSFVALSLAAVLSACGSGSSSNEVQNSPVSQDGTVVQPELSIEVVGRFASGIYGQSAAEIVQFHESSKSIFAINGALNRIEVISLAGLSDSPVAMPVADSSLPSLAFNFTPQVSVAKVAQPGAVAKMTQIILGDANSIAIHGDLLALAVAADNKTDNGAVLFYRLDQNGFSSFIKAVEVGALPDMVTFNHAGDKVIVANEGEPNKDFSVDPEGSISIVDITDGTPGDIATNINFTDNLVFNDDSAEDVVTESEAREYLQTRGVKFASIPGTTIAQDFEPEYIAVAMDDKKAYVSLQENNAIAVVDLTYNTVEVRGLGFKDWSHYLIDFTDKDKTADLQQVSKLYGMYQPDSIATYEYEGKTYILSANEGDAREYIYSADEATCTANGHTYDDGDCISYSEEVRVKDLKDNLSAELYSIYEHFGGKDGLGRLKVTSALGQIDENEDGILDVYDKLYAYGARSFSIWNADAELVFDSGDDFERVSSSILGDNFNSAHTANKGDNRSDDKGGEPEAIAVGSINGHQYAFIGLERSGDLFAYDVSNPYAARYVAHYNNRDFNTEFELDDDLANPCDTDEGMDCSMVDVSGDLGPESIKFVSAEQSPSGNALLLVGNEVSGTVTVYQVKEK